MEYSKEFVTSVVLGKDLVPRYLFYYGISSIQCIFILCCSVTTINISASGLSGSASHNWKVSDATFWKSYRKVISQR